MGVSWDKKFQFHLIWFFEELEARQETFPISFFLLHLRFCSCTSPIQQSNLLLLSKVLLLLFWFFSFRILVSLVWIATALLQDVYMKPQHAYYFNIQTDFFFRKLNCIETTLMWYGPTKCSFIQTYWPWYLLPKIHVTRHLTKNDWCVNWIVTRIYTRMITSPDVLFGGLDVCWKRCYKYL